MDLSSTLPPENATRNEMMTGKQQQIMKNKKVIDIKKLTVDFNLLLHL